MLNAEHGEHTGVLPPALSRQAGRKAVVVGPYINLKRPFHQLEGHSGRQNYSHTRLLLTLTRPASILRALPNND